MRSDCMRECVSVCILSLFPKYFTIGELHCTCDKRQDNVGNILGSTLAKLIKVLGDFLTLVLKLYNVSKSS